ncbi:MAG: hypothetical protein EA361_08885 [Bacteroidetes bacterium]|nr:MAG: hypothetical protein EA361_08885 [Bacteroidota bacterium]
MKNLLYMPVFIFLATLFTLETPTYAASPGDVQVSEKVVEVYYFHRNRRCGPCRTIENFTKKTMETYFTSEMESGEVVFHIVNVENDDQKSVAEKFSVVSTALFINIIEGKEENPSNLTSFAYRHARNEDAFLTGLKEHVDKGLGK